MSLSFADRREKRTKILDELLYAKPLSKEMQIMEAILTKMLRGSNKKLRDELWKFLHRWQFRVEMTDGLQETDSTKPRL